MPGRFVADRLGPATAARLSPADVERQRRRWLRWWSHVSAQCGPASGVRTLFDIVAMPMSAMLGFRAGSATFGPRHACATLVTGAGTSLGLLLRPWASRPSEAWRDLAAVAKRLDAAWCILVAPPFLSIVDTRGHVTRRSLDFALPDALDPRSFTVFSTLAAAKAFDAPPARPSDASRISSVVTAASTFQDRVREDLQQGVATSLATLTPVLGRPGSRASVDEALVLIYRILFLLFAESRELVPLAHPIYGTSYALGRLARESAGVDPPVGLWAGLAAVTRLSRWGCQVDDLVVRPFNGRLFARTAAPSLERRPTARRRLPGAVLKDRAVARVLAALASRPGPTGREEISYADLGVEQLGAVYERVLDLPLDAGAIGASAEGHEGRHRQRHSLHRRETGTFYTPQPLAEFVVRRTMAPLVAGRSADEILSLRVVDPAMGSGAFLVAACRFLADAYEQALVDEGRMSGSLDPEGRADVRRLIAERCLAGVDRNPAAVQLARLSLWLTTLARDKPLSFLDHRLRVGNSLVGASTEDIRRASRGRVTPPGGHPLFALEPVSEALRMVVRPLRALLDRRDDSIDDVRGKEAAWMKLTSDASPLRGWKLAASVWCARWFWPDTGGAPPGSAELRAIVDALVRQDRTIPDRHLQTRLMEVRAAEAETAFFHWTLEFADVFYDDRGDPLARGGFDAVVGNPPWEMLRREPDDRSSGGPMARERRRLVRFVRESGLYPSCDRGHLNLYQPFLERALAICKPGGRVGLVLPWGLAADEGAASLRRRLLESAGINTVVGLDNAQGLFPIHRGLRFLAMVACPGIPTQQIRGRFGVKSAAELERLPGRDPDAEAEAFPIRLTRDRLRRIGGAACRLPDCRTPDDYRLIHRVTEAFAPLGSRDGWNVRFGRELNATEDRPSFGAVGLPVAEGKHLRPFQLDVAATATRIRRDAALAKLPDRRFEQPRLGYRDVSAVTNRLTLIAAIIPAGVVTTHTILTVRSSLSLDAMHLLCAVFNSYVLNAVVRMLMGGHLTASLVESLPVPRSGDTEAERRIVHWSRHASSRPDDEAVAAGLQAEVAALYGLDAREYRRILAGFPLVPAERRERAARRFEQRVRP